jgi:hypothetical protein
MTAVELLTVLRRVEERGALETAHRIHQVCGQVFRYAIATGRASVTLRLTCAALYRPRRKSITRR